MSADLVIKGGTLVDGTGEPRRRAEVAITDGRISEIGVNLDGRKVIDASGASDAYWVAAAFGWLAAGIALLGQPALKRRVPVVSDA